MENVAGAPKVDSVEKLEADLSAWRTLCDERMEKMDKVGEDDLWCVSCDKVSEGEDSAFFKCKRCQEVAYCSKACQQSAEKESGAHNSEACRQLKLYSECVEVIQRENLQQGEPQWLPYKDVKAGTKLCKSWQAYAQQRGVPETTEVALGVITHALTFPMTLLFALDRGLQQLLAHPRDTFVIHILGAEESAEGNFPEKWMELLHWLPQFKNFEFHLIGPDLPEELDGVTWDCDTTVEAGQGEVRPYTVAFYRDLYHEAIENPDLTPADFAICFNSGLADFFDEWQPSLEILLAKNTPFAITSYHQREAEFDSRSLKLKLNARSLLGPMKNPFRSLLPISDPIFPSKVYYLNQYLSIFRGRIDPNAKVTRKRKADENEKDEEPEKDDNVMDEKESNQEVKPDGSAKKKSKR